jgi:hypothetical protein
MLLQLHRIDPMKVRFERQPVPSGDSNASQAVTCYLASPAPAAAPTMLVNGVKRYIPRLVANPFWLACERGR